jgi:hypothetical protein
MQHQSQDFTKKSNAGITGTFAIDSAIEPADIERHIARGKQMQAEAIAALLKGAFRRLGSLIPARTDPGTRAPAAHEEHLSRA